MARKKEENIDNINENTDSDEIITGTCGDNVDFSLNKNKFCNDAIEIEYEGVEFLKLIDQIVGQIKG